MSFRADDDRDRCLDLDAGRHSRPNLPVEYNPALDVFDMEVEMWTKCAQAEPAASPGAR